MPNPIYRFLNVHYYDGLIKFLKDEMDISTNKEELQKLYEENNARSMLAVNSRKVVGHMLVEKRYDFINSRYYFVLSNLWIKKEYRKLGIGTSMLKRLENYARRHKIYYFEIIPGNVPIKNLQFLTFNKYARKKDNIFFKSLKK